MLPVASTNKVVGAVAIPNWLMKPPVGSNNVGKVTPYFSANARAISIESFMLTPTN